MLPDSIPESVWIEFQKHRKRIRSPMTEYAETLILCKLEKWRIENGANPVDVIHESIERGWSGVFLNGHGKKTTEPAQMNKIEVCCDCGGPLTTGHYFTKNGRKCHAC